MPAAKRSVVAESLRADRRVLALARLSCGALIAAPAPPARGSKAQESNRIQINTTAKTLLDGATQRSLSN